ncbi:MAG: cellulase family glycosylhydrolase [Lachnospiraceae bacterium]|nr:cellulase family glycosylhydrolase [Lachnospiraceae bacterium]
MNTIKKQRFFRLFLALCCLFTASCLFGCNTRSSDADTSSIPEETKESAASTRSAGTKNVQATTEAPTTIAETTDRPDETASPALSQVTLINRSSWQSNGRYFCQIDAEVKNESGSELTDWEVRIPFSCPITLDGNWNGTYRIEENTLIVQAVDYNKNIPTGQTLTFGFIVASDTEPDLGDAQKQVCLFISGKEYYGPSTRLEESEIPGNSSGQDDTKNPDSPHVSANGRPGGRPSAGNSSAAASPSSPGGSGGNSSRPPALGDNGNPFGTHGALSIAGPDLVDQNGALYQLRGVSTHGLAWYPEYVNADAFRTLRDDWGANVIRLAMYTGEYGGYCTGGDREQLKQRIRDGVAAASDLGMYVIIDWHILSDGNPKTYENEAKDFFAEMSSSYAGYDNVLYEICNEPNGSSWADVKSYAESVIPVIRANDPNAVVIVGTPTWSQDVDTAADDPLAFENIMYSLHFYAATHGDNIRSKLLSAREKQLAILISEFSICDASGNGAVDYGQAEAWYDLIKNNNISYVGWSLSNKQETTALLKPGCSKLSGWTDDDLSETGLWLKSKLLNDAAQ